MSLFKHEPIAGPHTVEELQEYVNEQLDLIERAFAMTLKKELDWLHVAPSKVRQGLTVGADGTDWNPGSGEGVYTYYTGAWHKLG